MMLLDFVTLALTMLVVVDWLTVGLLWRVLRKAKRQLTPLPAASDRYRAALTIAIGSSCALAVGINHEVGEPLRGDWVLLLLVAAVVIPSLANVVFLIDVLRGVYR